MNKLNIEISLELAQAIGQILARQPSGDAARIFLDFGQAVQNAIDAEKKGNNEVDKSQ